MAGATLRITYPEDLDAARRLLLPRVPAEDLDDVLPLTLLLGANVAGRAEALVLQRLGPDWPLFLPQNDSLTLPAYYAQGDSDLARQLLHDALINFLCARLITLAIPQQIVATRTTIDAVSVEIDLDWTARGQTFTEEGYKALDLLRRPFPVPGRRFLTPAGGATGQLCQSVRPGTHAYTHDRRLPWGDHDPWRRW